MDATLAVRLPLAVETQSRLDAVAATLDPAALLWASGYLAGLAAERGRQGGTSVGSVAGPAAQANAPARALVLYASQTGNGRRLAERLGQALDAGGVRAVVQSVADYPARELVDERLVYLVASTHGDGDPPDDALSIIEFLKGRRAPRLEKLSFAVLALGDSSYPKFCATGRFFDERLAELGARRLAPRLDCDVDIEPLAGPWLESAVSIARTEMGAAQTPRLSVVTPLRPHAVTPATREHPVEIEVLVNQRITTRDAERDVRHLELRLDPEQFAYEPGDALGVFIENDPATVARTIELARLDGSVPVTLDGTTLPLTDWLTRRREVTRIGRALVEELARRGRDTELATLLEPGNGERLRAAMKTWQVADLLKRCPAEWEAERLIRALQPLSPRLYSIASSRREAADEAHLTVALIDYTFDGERRLGAATGQLARDMPGSVLRAYLEPNPRFRLPVDGERDVIMIGPGTGVAPFRGFLQQRIADGARGRHWLFFGARHRDRDFLYQLEWLTAQKKGQLQRLDVAFSRDASEKVYVQHRLLEAGAEVWSWLENGAHLYVCGDAQRMAPDVDAALHEIVRVHGGRSTESASDYLATLRSAHRYARDVY